MAFHSSWAVKGVQLALLWVERHSIGARGPDVTDVQQRTQFFVIDFQLVSFTGEFSS
ncbi:hypothetical protein PSSHI_47980 [Photobacterium sp. R1]